MALVELLDPAVLELDLRSNQAPLLLDLPEAFLELLDLLPQKLVSLLDPFQVVLSRLFQLMPLRLLQLTHLNLVLLTLEREIRTELLQAFPQTGYLLVPVLDLSLHLPQLT